MRKQKILLNTLLMVTLGALFTLEQNDFLYFRAKPTEIIPTVAQQPLSEISPNISKEVKDLLEIVYALERYKQDHRSYPISSTGGRGWDGLISSYGASGEDWIRGLVPDYIHKLPRDPRMLDDGTRQYIYKSNGVNYKLIAHKPDDCYLIKHSFPKLIDPIRECWSFGFWTNKAAHW